MPAPFEKSDSAAARLLRLVLKAKQIAVDSNTDQAKGWAVLLGLPANDLPAIFAGIGDFGKLIKEARAEILAIPEIDHDLHDASYNELAALMHRIMLQQGQPFSSVFGSPLADGTVRGLRFSADLVAKSSPRRIPEDELRGIANELDVIDNLAAQCPTQLRSLLARCTRLIRLSISHYNVFGSNGLDQAVQQAIGTLFLNREIAIVNQKTEPLKRFWDVIAKLNTLVSLAKNLTPALQAGAATVATLLTSSPESLSTEGLTSPATGSSTVTMNGESN